MPAAASSTSSRHSPTRTWAGTTTIPAGQPRQPAAGESSNVRSVGPSMETSKPLDRSPWSGSALPSTQDPPDDDVGLGPGDDGTLDHVAAAEPVAPRLRQQVERAVSHLPVEEARLDDSLVSPVGIAQERGRKASELHGIERDQDERGQMLARDPPRHAVEAAGGLDLDVHRLAEPLAEADLPRHDPDLRALELDQQVDRALVDVDRERSRPARSPRSLRAARRPPRRRARDGPGQPRHRRGRSLSASCAPHWMYDAFG